MTPDPIAMPATAAVADAARTMRDENIGDVIILEEHQMCGIVTDRDIVVGAIALGHDSPIALYTDATSVILDPYRKTTRSLVLMGPLERLSVSRFENPLPLDARALVVAPHLVLLVALTLLCFGVTYATFLRHEIRAI